MPMKMNMMMPLLKSNSMNFHTRSPEKMGMSHKKAPIIDYKKKVFQEFKQSENTITGVDFTNMKKNLQTNNRNGCSACSGTF